MTMLKYRIHDIVTYNVLGTMGVGIIVKITVAGEKEIFYKMDNGLDIREDQITKWLHNAADVQRAVDFEEGIVHSVALSDGQDE